VPGCVHAEHPAFIARAFAVRNRPLGGDHVGFSA
jgi:hypothetical protein